MKILIGSIFAGIMIISLGITALLYHDLYEKEKEKTATSQGELVKLKELVKANELNGPDVLTKKANQFTQLLFGTSKKDAQDHKKALLSLTTGKAYRELTKVPIKASASDTNDLKGFESEAHIKESIYNKISSTEGKVIVQFEQWLTKDGNTSKTLNEMTVNLEYSKNEWKVSDYEIKPLF